MLYMQNKNILVVANSGRAKMSMKRSGNNILNITTLKYNSIYILIFKHKVL